MNNLGELLWNLGDLSEAEKCFVESVEFIPSNEKYLIEQLICFF